MKKIVYMKFGSHLYGTDTPESDTDYKGVYVPTKRQIILSDFPATLHSSTGTDNEKNGADDIDDEIFSLHRFIKLAMEGQTVAIDMVHAPKNMIIESSDIWRELVANREKLYTKNLNAFVGYCRKQAAKYGVKGSRLSDAKNVISFLSELHPDKKLGDVWNVLPKGEHINWIDAVSDNPRSKNMYQVCGKKFQESARAKYVLDALNIFIENYGHRAKLAEKNEGIDWKAISHAMRAAYQLESIYLNGTITFPLKQAEYLKSVKQGKLDYMSDVSPKLEELMDKTEHLAKESSLPEHVDTAFWKDFLYRAIAGEI